MKKFIKNTTRFFTYLCLLLAIPTALYVRKDVFLDFGKKENYSWTYYFQGLGDISTKKLLQSSKNYNSFIFGSSRTVSLYACYLQEQIPNSRFFHYANWNQSIEGVERKLMLLDSLGYHIDNVIIYLDTDYTFAGTGQCQYSEHYLLTQETQADYLMRHLREYFGNFNMQKAKILLDIPVQGAIFPNWHSDLHTNDPTHQCSNPQVLSSYPVANESDAYKAKIDLLDKNGAFPKNNKELIYKADQISISESKSLENIRRILDKHHSNYYAIITPLCDQQKFSLADQQILQHHFGEKLYDFSGINEITSNIYNYPDASHFQHFVSKNMIDSVLSVSPAILSGN